MTELIAGLGRVPEAYIPTVLIAMVAIIAIKTVARRGSGSDDDTDTPAKG